MSATGSGISEIFGFTLAAGGAAGSQVNFTHNLGTRAIQVYCCDAVTGRQLDGTEISVAQPTANVVQIANVTTGAVVVNISIRWQYDTVELDTVPTTDARLATAVGPPPVAVGIAGGGALNQVTYWTGAATIAGNAMLTTDPATGDLDRIKNVPYDWPAANAAGVLTNDGAGNLTWAPAGAGANTALSNLAAVAVNAALNPGLDNAIGIGTSALRWSAVNATSLFARDDATNTVRTQYSATSITANSGAAFTLDATAVGQALNLFGDIGVMAAASAGPVQLFGVGTPAVELNGSGSTDTIVIQQMNYLIVDGTRGMRVQSAQGAVSGGTAALPSISVGTVATTGLFQDVASELGVTNAGVETMRFTADRALEISASTAAVSAAGKGRIRYLAASNTLQISNNGGAYVDINAFSIGGTVTGGTQGSVLFVGAASVLAQDNANFFWDDAANQLRLGVGSAANPAYAFSGDVNTGVFSPAADKVAVSVGGSQMVTVQFAAPAAAGNVNIVCGSVASGTRGVYITGTLANTGTATFQYGVQAEFAGSGAGNDGATSFLANLLAGYTGSGFSGGAQMTNASAGTGTDPYAAGINGNHGALIQATGATAGTNVGALMRALNSTARNYGSISYVVGAGGALSVGVSGFVYNNLGTQVAGLFTLNTGRSFGGNAPAVSAVLLADNGDTTAPIFLGRDNSTTVFTIADGGVVSVGIDGTAALPALTFGATADPNTGIFHPAADTLALSTNGTEAMRIISTGEIGIGNAITPGSNTMVRIERNTNAEILEQIVNTTNGTASAATLQLVSEGSRAARLMEVASGNTNANYSFAAGHTLLQAGSLVAGHSLYLNALNATGNIVFVAGGTTESGRFSSAGDFGVGVTPTEKMSLKDHTAFAGSETQLTTGAVQTADGTTTPAKTLALSDNTLYWFEADIIGRQTGGTDRAYYKVAGLFYRQGGGAATLEGAVASVITAIETAGAAAWNATLAASGNNVVVNVTGAAATTINWTCTVRYQAVSGNA